MERPFRHAGTGTLTDSSAEHGDGGVDGAPEGVAAESGAAERPAGDRYRLGPERARGGLGRIVEAWDGRMGRVVALKQVLVPTPAAMARLDREALLTGRLDHPSIIAVYDHGRLPDGTAFYAMKLVEGRSLRDEIAARATL